MMGQDHATAQRPVGNTSGAGGAHTPRDTGGGRGTGAESRFHHDFTGVPVLQRSAHPGELLGDDAPERLARYLSELDEAGEPLRRRNSDDLARRIVRKWSRGDARFVLTSRRKALLIRELMTGRFSILDQRGVLNLLERSSKADLLYVFAEGEVRHEELLAHFDGPRRKQLQRFYRRRFPHAFGDEHTELNASLSHAEPPLADPDLGLLGQIDPHDDAAKGNPAGEMLSVGERRFPKSTRLQDEKSTKLRGRTTREEAADLVHEVYKSFIGDGEVERVKQLSFQQLDGADFDAALQAYCKGKEHCTSPGDVVRGFHDRNEKKIVVHETKQIPTTILHEVIHAFAHPNFLRIAGKSWSEGVPEFLARRVALHRGGLGKRRLAILQQDDQELDFVQELVLAVGEELVARAYFKGEIGALRAAIAALGKSGDFPMPQTAESVGERK